MRTEAELAIRNATLRSFAHTVSHDLRAPLRGIVGYAHELELHRPYSDEQSRRYLTEIATAAQTLEQLIEDSLTYAKLDAETPVFEMIDLPVFMAALLQQRAARIREYNAEVVTHFAVTKIVGWERGLGQVLGNILDNALKYSRDSRPPRIRFESAETSMTWRLLVCDNGIGFNMRHHDRIFSLFRRLVSANEFEGTGAGLAIVRKIIDRLGGSIQAEARPGSGATFLIELPKSAAAEIG
jgi:hypothetical protein